MEYASNYKGINIIYQGGGVCQSRIIHNGTQKVLSTHNSNIKSFLRKAFKKGDTIINQ